MLTTRLKGGLGNQLFQIFCLIALSLKYNKPFVFQYSDKLRNRSTYWNNFLIELKKFTTNENIITDTIVLQRGGFHYKPINLNVNINTMLDGYYQSYKYFIEYEEQIYQLINLRHQKDLIKNKYPEYFKTPAISMHFRLGDYKHMQEHHPLLDIDYYKNALKCIQFKYPNVKRVIYFCESEDNVLVNEKIQNLLESNSGIEFIKASDDLKDWEQMLLMSTLDYHIIANSTFSWWGAYLSNKNLVIYPSIWFGIKKTNHNTKDLFPTDWIKI